MDYFANELHKKVEKTWINESIAAKIHEEQLENHFDSERMGTLAHIVTKGLGVPIGESRKYWHYDSPEREPQLNACGNLDSLTLCLRSETGEKTILISVRARKGEDSCDKVIVRMIDHSSPTEIGVEYEIFIQRPKNSIMDETVTTFSTRRETGGTRAFVKMRRSSLREGCDLYYKETTDDNVSRTSFLERNEWLVKLKQIQMNSSSHAKAAYAGILSQEANAFSAMQEVVGDLSGYSAVPSENI